MFGNTGNLGLWGLATGFGSNTGLNLTTSNLFGNSGTSNTTAPALGSLFGNSQKPTLTIGTGLSLTLAPLGGLFGNSSTASKPAGGLFGNSNPGATTGGLFGNSNTAGTTGGTSGLFGNSNTAGATGGTSGLFGNSNTAGTTGGATGGLFGSSTNKPAASTGGLFGGSTNNTTGATGTSGSLFGGSTNTSSGGGLFGNNTGATGTTGATGGLFGSSSTSAGTTGATGGLFGNSSTGTTGATGGLFGGANANATGGLFGLKPATGTTTGLFGLSAATTAFGQNGQPTTDNVYGAGNLLQSMAATDSMPALLTQNLTNGSSSAPRTRKYSYLEKPVESKPRNLLLSRFGKTLRIFRDLAALAAYNPFRGMLSSSDSSKKPPLALPSTATSKLTTFSTGNVSLQSRLAATRGLGSLKRLIIKLKPIKYHMINANRVIERRQQRMVDTAPQLLLKAPVSDEDEEDVDMMISAVALGRTRAKSLVVFAGDPVPVVEVAPVETIPTPVADTKGYYIYPSVAEIISQPQLVENLVIGRRGHLKIAWEFPVDILGVVLRAETSLKHLGNTVEHELAQELFDNIVKLEGPVVQVYKPGDSKPAMRQELNVPAVITVENIRPKNGQSTTEFIGYLKKQLGMEFVAYDPIKGDWTFRVIHFSVWGLLDDADTLVKQLKQQQDAEEEWLRAEYLRIYESDAFSEAARRTKVAHQGQGVPGGWGRDDTTINSPLVVKRAKVGAEVSRNVLMAKPDMSLLVGEADITVELDDDMGMIGVAVDGGAEAMEVVEEPTRDVNYLRDLLMSGPPGQLEQVINEKAYEPMLDLEKQFDNILLWPDLPTTDTWLVQLELANDFNSLVVPTPSELHSEGAPIRTLGDVDRKVFSPPPRPVLAPAPTSTTASVSPVEDTTGIVDAVQAHATTTTRGSSGYPHVVGYSNLLFGKLATRAPPRDVVYYLLAQALFDDVGDVDVDDVNIRNRRVEVRRREVFGNWLKKYNRKFIHDVATTNPDPLELAFVHLCLGDLEGAITAIPHDRPHLRAVLVLADANDDKVRQIAANQLDEWEDQANINPWVVKIWQILANDFSPVAQLPWLVQLATKLSYGKVFSLADVIGSMDLKHGGTLTTIMQAYYLLQTTGSGDALEFIAGSQLEPSLKWVIYAVVKHDTVNHKLGDAVVDEGDKVVEELVPSLIAQRGYPQAVFAYLTMSNDELAVDGIRKVVIDHISEISETGQLQLISAGVPQSLIYEALGNLAGSVQDYWVQCQNYIMAGMWEETHKIIVDHLGPEVVMTGSREARSQLLELVSKIPNNGLVVTKWTQGGEVYVNYVKLLGDDTEVLAQLVANLPFLVGKPLEAVDTAKRIMARAVGDTGLNHGIDGDSILNLPLGPVDKNYFRLRLE